MMAWWERAKVGDKVVAIKYDWTEPNPKGSPIINVGDALEILGIFDKPTHGIKGCSIYLRFKEHSNPHSKNWFIALAFCPIQTTDSGMATLRGLLNPKKHKVDEPV